MEKLKTIIAAISAIGIFFFFAAMQVSKAQITWDSTDIALPGTMIFQATDTVPSIVPGGAGPSQIWNFSAINNQISDTLFFSDPALVANGDAFPNSNLVFVQPNNDPFFLKITSAKLTALGLAGDLFGTGDTIIISFDPEMVIFEFPENYQDTLMDTSKFILEMPNVGGLPPNFDSIRIINTSYTNSNIDAWGTVYTPLDTFDCLRQYSEEISIDSAFGHDTLSGNWVFFSPPQIDTTVTYSWLAKDVGFPVVDIELDSAGNVMEAKYLYALPASIPISATITSSTNPVCNGDCNGQATVTAIGGAPPYTYSWDDTTTQTTKTATGLCAGTYIVMVTDTLLATSSDTIVISDPPAVVANITAGGPATFCAGDSVELASDTAGITSYDWLLNSVSTADTGWTYNALMGGDYQVVVWNAFGCYDTSAATTVTVNPLPVITVTPNPGVVCGTGDSVMIIASGAASYAWSPPTDLSATTGDTAYANPTTNTTYTVIGTDANSCVDSTTVLVQLSTAGAVASFTSDVISGCGSVTVTFDGSLSTDAIGYSWSFPGGTPNTSNLQNPVVTYDTVGVWNVTLTAFGCGGLDSIIIMSGYITVDSLPTVTFTALANVCDTITALALTGGSPAGGTYSGPNVNGGNFNAQAAGFGTYTITYTYTDGITGCTDSATQPIAVDSCPLVGVMELFDAANSIRLYPNPTAGVINIDVEADMKVASIKVYNIIGSLVVEVTNNSGLNNDHYSIDLSTQPKGTYLVKIQTAEEVIVRKLNLNF